MPVHLGDPVAHEAEDDVELPLLEDLPRAPPAI
jgi:hypothetical protein